MATNPTPIGGPSERLEGLGWGLNPWEREIIALIDHCLADGLRLEAIDKPWAVYAAQQQYSHAEGLYFAVRRARELGVSK